jgi:hypothetical protein
LCLGHRQVRKVYLIRRVADNHNFPNLRHAAKCLHAVHGYRLAKQWEVLFWHRCLGSRRVMAHLQIRTLQHSLPKPCKLWQIQSIMKLWAQSFRGQSFWCVQSHTPMRLPTPPANSTKLTLPCSIDTWAKSLQKSSNTYCWQNSYITLLTEDAATSPLL